jgi:lambda family phage portal protein
MAMRNPLIQQNLLDKAITYLSPKLGQKRMIARTQLALAGGYSGARIDTSTMARYMPNAGSPLTDIIPGLRILRARSRDQMRNSPIALGALQTQVNHVVGTGLSYTPAINATILGLSEEEVAAWSADTKWRFDTWAANVDCDLGRRLNFYGQQDLTFRSMMESGDVFVTTPVVQREGRARLALQVIEADRVCNPNGDSNTDTRIDGIEINAETTEAVGVYVAKRHPADGLSNNSWTKLDVRGASGRRNVLHLFDTIRPGQVRGVPWIAPILEPLKQLQRWSDAELNAAVVSSLFAVFIKMDPDAFDDMFDEASQRAIIDKASSWDGSVESGQAVNLLPGESVEAPNPGRPNPAFDPFWTAMVRQIGMALEMPFEVLVAHFQSSYSAARAALLMAWKAFRRRRDRLVTYLCQPVFELWLADEVAAGRIHAPGFFASEVVRAAWCGATWTGDGPGSIDPTKEVTAAADRVALGISTKDAESIAFDGIPWEVKHKQRVREVSAEQRDGLTPAPKNTNASAGDQIEVPTPSNPGNKE